VAGSVHASVRATARARTYGTRIVLLSLTLALSGCLSVRTPDYVLRHRDQLEQKLNVKIDISHASSFTGNVDRVLKEIDRQLSPLPAAYRAKIARIAVRDGFFREYMLCAPFVGAYTAKNGTVFIRNANATRFIQNALLFPGNDVLTHEVTHSVQYHEMKHWGQTGRPTPEFERLIRNWELQYLGDVNRDSEIDDIDIEFIQHHKAAFDKNRDGNVDFRDVELSRGKPYVQGNWISINGLKVFLRMSFGGLVPRPNGYPSSYAKTYVWEDAAETMRWAWSAGLLPALYSSGSESAAADKAWKRYEGLKKRDPLFARKVCLMLQYVASHEEPERLSARWVDYTRRHSVIASAKAAQ